MKVLTNFIITITFIFTIVLFFAQSSAAVMWDQTYGTTAGRETGDYVLRTSDGGYLIAGEWNFNLVYGGDACLIKTDALGNLEWNYLVSEELGDKFWGAVEVADGSGYVVTGFTQPYEEMVSDLIICKVDPNGNELWVRLWGEAFETDGSRFIIQTEDGGFIITGYTKTQGEVKGDLLLLKVDSEGYEEWFKTYGGAEFDHGRCIQLVKDNNNNVTGYIITGWTYSFGAGDRDGWLLKYDLEGNLEWDKTFGTYDGDWLFSVAQTSDLGFIVAGDTGIANPQAWLIKTDSDGNEEWSKLYGGSGWDRFFSVQVTSDNGYILTGYRDGTGPKTYFSNPEWEEFSAVTGSDAWLLKTDSEGNEEWSKVFGGTDTDEGRYGQQISENSYIITGDTYSYGSGNGDIWLIYYEHSNNQPPYPPTLLTPADNSEAEPGLVTFTWLNNGDPENDLVGSWLYALGPWNQVISMDMGASGFNVGEEIYYSLSLFPGQEWAWTIYIYDPNYNSDPYYAFQEPFWHFTISGTSKPYSK